MLLYLHTISVLYQFREGFVLPATVGLFSTSEKNLPLVVLDGRAKRFLLSDLKYMNQEHTNRTGEPYMPEDSIEQDVRSAEMLRVTGYGVQVFEPAREILLKSWINPN